MVKRYFWVIILIPIALLTGCGTSYTPAPSPTNTSVPVSLPVSADVNLNAFTQAGADQFSNPKYAAETIECTHVSAAISLNEGITLRITLESDILIDWQGDFESPRPELAVALAQMMSFTDELGWTTIATNSVETKHVVSSNQDKELDIVVVVHPKNPGASIPDTFKLLAINLDSQNPHQLKYTISEDMGDISASSMPEQEPTPDVNPVSVPMPNESPSTMVLAQKQSNIDRIKSYITPDNDKVKALVNDILNGDERLYWNDFNALRDWVSWHVSYQSDMDIHGQPEYWQTPAETLELGTGDCEDFAILLCSLLRAYGVPTDQVFVACGYSDEEASGHAYLVERWYRGIWQVIEPQAGGWTGPFIMDWLTNNSYNISFYFNDQEFFEGMPSLPAGAYEFEIPQSYYPASRGSFAIFERHLDAGETITGTVEWPADRVWADQSYAMLNDWSLNIYAPDDAIAYSWSGKDMEHVFSFTSTVAGNYKIEILKRDYLARCARLTIDPPDWK